MSKDEFATGERDKLRELLENIIQVRGGLVAGFITGPEKMDEMARLAAEALLTLGELATSPSETAKMPEKGYYDPCPVCELTKFADKPMNEDALGEAAWAMLKVVGSSIHVNDCKEKAREVVRAYFASIKRQASFVPAGDCPVSVRIDQSETPIKYRPEVQECLYAIDAAQGKSPSATLTSSEINDALDIAECAIHDKVADPSEREWLNGILKKLREEALARSVSSTPSMQEIVERLRFKAEERGWPQSELLNEAADYIERHCASSSAWGAAVFKACGNRHASTPDEVEAAVAAHVKHHVDSSASATATFEQQYPHVTQVLREQDAKDAARYRWLRMNAWVDQVEHDSFYLQFNEVPVENPLPITDAEVDRLVDEAIELVEETGRGPDLPYLSARDR